VGIVLENYIKRPQVHIAKANRTDTEKVVPVNIKLPDKMGGVNVSAPVTQKTADSIISAFMGGILVAIGVFIAAMFGIRLNNNGRS
jgi:hypothetical protein